MKIAKIGRILGIYLALWVFALVCAVAIAETEILEEYRYLVYLGVCLVLFALGFLVSGLWLLALRRLQKKLDVCQPTPVEERILCLQKLLAQCRTASFRGIVSLNLVYGYLEASQRENAFALLSLLNPQGAFYFPLTEYRLLVRVCACIKNNRSLFERYRDPKTENRGFDFLPEEEKRRWIQWENEPWPKD